MQAIILAGGKGTRLKPLTTSIPKPLVPIDDMPILEVILLQLRHYGFTDVVMAVNHLADLIMAFFGDGRKWGLNIQYSIEDSNLGTAGPLSLIKNLDENFLVMNGDLLTTLDYGDLYNSHISGEHDVSIACYKKEVKIDLGVLKIENGQFVDYIEKPVYNYDVSMGIYMMNKKVIEHIPYNTRLDIPDLMLNLRDNKFNIRCYSRDYYWLDIGRIDDYETAVNIFQDRRSEFLHNG